MTNYTATPAQKDFILSLLADRKVDESLIAHLNENWETLTKQEASATIDALKACPRSAGPSASIYDGLAKSFYAVPAHVANATLTDLSVSNDLLFLVIDEFRGTVYMRQVHGAPGDFSRTRMTRADSKAMADLLRTDALGFITLFGQHFTVCGKCGANLTDQASRERGFGPDCARQLGLR
jgi:hypothetical protein